MRMQPRWWEGKHTACMQLQRHAKHHPMHPWNPRLGTMQSMAYLGSVLMLGARVLSSMLACSRTMDGL